MTLVRIAPKELAIIKSAFQKHFSNADHLWVFGSRADLTRRGGDLDFYIETVETNPETALKNKTAFVNELWEKLGEQKIDVVLNLTLNKSDVVIYEVAKKTGIKIL
jgi:predicted nucleotidyltransferase